MVCEVCHSQMRYVHYYEQYLKKGPPVIKTYQITHIRLITVPNFDVVRAPLTLPACVRATLPLTPHALYRAAAATRTSKCGCKGRKSTTTRST